MKRKLDVGFSFAELGHTGMHAERVRRAWEIFVPQEDKYALTEQTHFQLRKPYKLNPEEYDTLRSLQQRGSIDPTTLSVFFEIQSPQNLIQAAQYFALQENRLPVLASLGCGPAIPERELLKKGLARAVNGVEPFKGGADRIIRDTRLQITFVETSNRTPDEQRAALCSALGAPDIIFFGDSLHHTPDPYSYIAQCYDILPPGGYGVVSEPFHAQKDVLTPQFLHLDDKTEHHESMLSIEDHAKWINWVVLRGGGICHSEATPMSMVRTDDVYHRAIIVFQKGREDGEIPLTVPRRHAVDRSRTPSELERTALDIWPFSLLNQPEQETFAQYLNQQGVTIESLNQTPVGEIFYKIAFALGDRAEVQRIIDEHLLTKMIPEIEEKFGTTPDLQEQKQTYIELALMTKFLRETLGIDITPRLIASAGKKFKRGFSFWEPKRHMRDPYQLLVAPEAGVSVLHPHKAPNVPEIIRITNGLLQAKIFPGYPYLLPEQDIWETPFKNDSDIFSVWPMTLIREEDRPVLLREIYKCIGTTEEGGDKQIVGVLGEQDGFKKLKRALIKWLIPENLTNDAYGNTRDEKLEAATGQFVYDNFPFSKIEFITRLPLKDGEDSIEQRDYFAGETIALANILSEQLHLGYVIDLMAKQPGWETLPIAAHKRRGDQKLIIPR